LLVAQYWTGLIPYFRSSTFKRLPITPIQQQPDMCGPAAATMYINYQKSYYGASGLSLISQADIYKLMRAADSATESAPGVTVNGLYLTLNNLLTIYTLITTKSYTQPYVVNSPDVVDTTALLMEMDLINRYEPSIVYWYSADMTHFVTMIGIDQDNNQILCNDPNNGKYRPVPLQDWLKLEYFPTAKARVFIGRK